MLLSSLIENVDVGTHSSIVCATSCSTPCIGWSPPGMATNFVLEPPSLRCSTSPSSNGMSVIRSDSPHMYKIGRLHSTCTLSLLFLILCFSISSVYIHHCHTCKPQLMETILLTFSGPPGKWPRITINPSWIPPE